MMMAEHNRMIRLEVAAREALRTLMLIEAMAEVSSLEQSEDEKQTLGLRCFHVQLDRAAADQIRKAKKRIGDLGIDLHLAFDLEPGSDL